VPRYRVTNLTRNTLLAVEAEVAASFGGRLRGLLGREGLAPGGGLWLWPCDGIHTCFLRFPIDALVLDATGGVLAVYPALAPWRVSRRHRGARGVLELPAGTAAASGTRPGDVVGLAITAPAQNVPLRRRGRLV
jgi:uncharacterized membrane protein (UPF0127 family)